MDSINNLVLAPFIDVVTKGKQAVDKLNEAAGASSNGQTVMMIRAAQGLVSNGERAVKKVEPVCKRGWEEYGVGFVDALKENDEISGFREKLNEMLWDLDDGIETGNFDQDVFTQLQGLLRTAALRTADIIVRMKLQPLTTESKMAKKTAPEQVSPPPVNPWSESPPPSINETDVNERRPRIAEQPRADSPTLERLPIRTRPEASTDQSLMLERYSQTSITSHPRDSMVSPTSQSENSEYPVQEGLSPLTPFSRPHSYQQWHVPEPTDQAGLEPAHQQQQQQQSFDDGLIPVTQELEPSLEIADGIIVPESTAITPHSSFHQFRGFCDGANEVMRGNLGVKKIKQPTGVLGAGVITAAKCKHCMFELDWALVEADLHRHASATYKTCGVNFRLRFLSKSHLPARRVDDQLYGCVFCVSDKKTTETTDATVFFSQKQLFAHLARHPRPLPPIPGLVVIQAADVPPEHANNFDLHFSAPPVRSHMPGLAQDLRRMPTAVAIETFRQVHGALRSPPDRATVLQFAIGARIVGVEFPARYNGEWAVGWTDNTRAVFPVDHVRFVRPSTRTGNGGNSMPEKCFTGGGGFTAVARWKRHPKEKEKEKEGEWLRFDKGEVITGISFPHVNHWCYAGYNAKGKHGLFPQAFLEPGTLSDAGDAAASVHSSEGKGVFSRLTRRRRDPRRTPSIAESGSGSGSVGGRSGSEPSVR